MSAGILLSGTMSFAESIYKDLVIEEALVAKLYEDITWLKLLHLDPNQQFGKKKSEIHSESFFLSPTGRGDSRKELIATIDAIFDVQVKDPNQHAQCAFRGRFSWLKRKLALDKSLLPRVECREFNEWSQQENIDSLSLVYATGYLGNPASYYGHTLIKINTKNTKISNLEDSSINFGANVPDGEGMAPYILKGLFGGYDSSFTSSQYFYHSHNYAEVELRDLWEYKLDLSQYEIDLLLGHLWELLGKKYTYYFLNKNCSHRMAEVFSILDDVNAVPNSFFWSMPQSFLQKLAKVERDGKRFVKKVVYHPSRQASLYNRYRQLTENQRRTVSSLIDNPETLAGKKLESLELTSKHQVLDTLLDFYQFKRDSEALEKDKYNEQYRQVLKQRYSLPPGVTENNFLTLRAPHLSRKPSYLNMKYIDSSSGSEGVAFRLRPAYYDNLDGSYGHVEGAALSMGEFAFSISDDTVRLSELNIVNVESINTKATGLPGDKGKYWRLRVGGERESLEESAKFIPVVNLAAGKGTNFRLNNSYFAAFLGAGLGENTQVSDFLFGEAGIFAVTKLSDRFSASLRYSWKEYLIDSKAIDRGVSSFSVRYHTSRNTDLRILYNKNIEEEASISFGFYW